MIHISDLIDQCINSIQNQTPSLSESNTNYQNSVMLDDFTKSKLRVIPVFRNQGVVWQCNQNNSFQCLNSITRISTHFFTHTYFQKIQTTLLEQHYQMGSKYLNQLGLPPQFLVIFFLMSKRTGFTVEFNFELIMFVRFHFYSCHLFFFLVGKPDIILY